MQNTDREYTESLISFIGKSPSSFHAVRNLEEELTDNGFIALDEKRRWSIERGKSYFVTRNGSALIAFRIPEGKPEGFSIIASHTDSPSFKVKVNPEIVSSGLYTTLNAEGYGGMLIAPWFDRPLSIAGRVFIRNGNGYESRLVDFARPFVMIPSLAIHMDRKVNEGHGYSIQKELTPLFAEGIEKGRFMRALAEAAGTDEKNLLEYDLHLYPRMDGTIWGLDNEFFSAPKIDDLMCAYSSIQGLINAKNGKNISIAALFDNEETGSGTKQGALSDFMKSAIKRICLSLGINEEEKAMLLASSHLISADNCHALHPCYAEKCDVTNKPRVNGGVAIKFSAAQKYTTDAESASFLRCLLEDNGIPYQYFVNNSDIPGGSTLGNLSQQEVSIPSVDIGAAQLAMHSPYETAGVKDVKPLIDLGKVFFGI